MIRPETLPTTFMIAPEAGYIDIASPIVAAQMATHREPELAHDWHEGITSIEESVIALQALALRSWRMPDEAHAPGVAALVRKYFDDGTTRVPLHEEDASYLQCVMHEYASVDPEGLRRLPHAQPFLLHLPAARYFDGWRPKWGLTMMNIIDNKLTLVPTGEERVDENERLLAAR